jgi:hypothetical protein
MFDGRCSGGVDNKERLQIDRKGDLRGSGLYVAR